MRSWIDRAFFALTATCAALAGSLLLVILSAIVWRGGPALDLDFFTEPIRAAGASDGILYHVIGTAILIATVAAVSAPVAWGSHSLTASTCLRDASARASPSRCTS
jgi:ABC-type phosphate transport system permease subunit